jgi:putative FmdB family regulatory protein
VPTYQYACTECGHDLEAVQSFTDDALTECPECAGRLRKVFSPVGVVFKGSGFYRTDSRSAAASVDSASSSSSGSSSAGSSSSSSSASSAAASSSSGSSAASSSASPSPKSAAAS